jgi:ribosomal protein S18 acetylase RimI-like enzyme
MNTSDSNSVQFQFTGEGVNWTELIKLFKAANLAAREGDKIRRAFENSTVVCFATRNTQLIGAARALSDGEYHATIYDVIVAPEFQRQGMGALLMKALLARLPVWRILLVADGDASRFYQRLGFEPYADVLARIDPSRLFDEQRN